jgi:trehalose 6-phosphate synthase/phosphatase
MPKKELRHRISTMHTQVSTHTVQHWAKQFMGTLQKPIAGTRAITRTLTRDREQDIADSFRLSHKRTLLLDYDGVLSPFYDDPAAASPTKALRNLLAKLAREPRTDVAIISGRSRDDLDRWLGDLELTLIAEHGAYTRKAGNKNWKKSISATDTWKDEVELILEKYAARTPGAFVETKNFSLVWHYRKAPSYHAQKNLVTIKRLLGRLARKYGLEVRSGNKILEVKPQGINKGVAALGRLQDQPDFVLCIGDDYTDEDMFTAMPVTAYTVKVGRGPTQARFRVKDSERVQALLRRLVH